jgi:sugar/nucleoside kinase (ribokinase family)
VPDLLQNVLAQPHLDIFGLNENELWQYSNWKASKKEEDIVDAAVSLKKKIQARLDVHTAQFACTVHKTVTVVPTVPLSKIYRGTGAGDAWNAGDIFAELLDFDDEERLLFSNSVAGRYISSPEPVHPTLDEVVHFIETIE